MEDGKIKWFLRPWIVLALLFLVLGPLGLPLVYKCPKFGKPVKVFLTLAMIAYTFYLVQISMKTGREVFDRVTELQNIILCGK